MELNTERTIHLPLFVVPEQCAETCKNLRIVKNDATLRAVDQPDSQMIVICSRFQRFSCGAHTYDAGMWMYIGDGAGTKRYFGNPSIIENATGCGSVHQRIKTAKESGDAREYTELPAI